MSKSADLADIAVGCGAGFSGDRVDAALPVVRTLIERGGPAALIFEMLAERTLATAQLARRADPGKGFDPLLEMQLRPVLAECLRHGIAIVSNFGAANPHGAAERIAALAAELHLPAPRVAVVTGDDLSGLEQRPLLREALSRDTSGQGGPFDDARFVCANAYLGAFEIAQALREGAQIVVTGRVADPALVLGPAIAHHGWSRTDWHALAGGTMAGHLLECGAQVTGGYFADPGRKDVSGLEEVGFPIAEIAADGSCIIGKAARTGGLVDIRTVKEQLLYEIHDPASYLTPDVVADITAAEVVQLGPDRVRLSGVRGHPHTGLLKVCVFFEGGWFGEAEISYAGPNAQARARLAMEVIAKRCGGDLSLRFDLIGITSIFGDDGNRALDGTPVAASGEVHDVRLRVAARHDDVRLVDMLLREVTALWTCGPAGGGGVRTNKRQRLSMRSCLVPRGGVPVSVQMFGSAPSAQRSPVASPEALA